MTTRKNACPNPAAINDTTGWGGNAAFSRNSNLADGRFPVNTGISITGNGFSQTPTGLCAPGDIFTVSFYLRNRTGVSFSARTVYLSHTRSGSGDTFDETFTVTPGADGNVVRGSYTTLAAPSDTIGIYLIVDALNGTLGSGFDISAVLYEKVGTLDTYFDGSFPNASWDGAAGNSPSTLVDTPAIPPGAFLPLL